MTKRMLEVARKVYTAHRFGRWYRAEGSGERPTLAALYRHGVLERRAWRGAEGEADAAHEYRMSAAALAALKEE